jgi:uncharacterized membrane protein YbhN (UPF0104 family)
LRAALPWLGAAALLALAAWRVDLAEVGGALGRARWGAYLAAAAAFSVLWLVLDSLVLARLVSRFHQPLSWRRMLPLRGASYLLMAFSSDAAQLGLGLALHRRYGVSAFALGGTYLFYYLIDVATIGALGSLGARSLPGGLGHAVRIALALVVAAAAAAFVLLSLLSRAPAERVPERLRGARLLATLRRARLRDVAEFAAWRAAFYASFVAFAALSLPAFGVGVPLRALVGLVPVIMSVAALPITASGLGSTQLAMGTLYRPFADPAAILAYSVVYSATLVLLRVPIALLCLPFASDVLRRREPDRAAFCRGRTSA